MAEYSYRSASSLEEALSLLKTHAETARIVNGGTDTMVRLHIGRCPGCTFINIRGVEALRYIREENGEICIGAGTTIDALAHSLLLLKKAPALFQAANVFADPTIRHSATIGGNIGNASPSADTAPSLLCFEADAVVERAGGRRILPMTSFFTGVGRTALDKDELVTELRFRPMPDSAFIKIGLRSAMAISLVNIACAVKLDGEGCMEDVRIAVGAVAPTPIRAAHAEAVLRGKKPEKEAIDLAMAELQKDVKPITDVRASAEYRRLISANMMRRVVLKACGRCETEEEEME